MKQSRTKNVILTALFLALGILFPSMFHMIGAGPVFLPMHIPILICGMLCGWQYGALCGLIVPLLSSVMTGMPPFFPTAIAMMFELGAYGCFAGLLYRSQKYGLYVSLIGTMLGGRIISGIANAILLGFAGKPYGLSAFLSAAFLASFPGILLQLAVIPAVIAALQKAGFVPSPRAEAASIPATSK